MKMIKNLSWLFVFCVSFSLLVGCDFYLPTRDEMQEDFQIENKNDIENNDKNNGIGEKVEEETNKNVVKLGNNNYYEKIGKKYVYSREIDCYELQLKNIGIYARIPNYVLNDNYKNISSFNEIKIEKESDFNNTYVISNNDNFTIFTPSGYLLLANKIKTNNEILNIIEKEELTKKDAEIIYQNLFKNSFIEENTEKDTTKIRKVNDTYIISKEVFMYPINQDKETSYMGYAITYIDKGNIRTLVVGASTFSFQENVGISICDYIVHSSYIAK